LLWPIGETLDRDIESLSYRAEQRTLRFRVKGGDERERPLPAHRLEALDEYVTVRAPAAGSTVDTLSGPLFATTGADGRVGRLAEPNVYIWLRILANAAGMPSAGRSSPHLLRQAFATHARQLGKPLEDVQDGKSHADPRTTRR
jgi:integrase/recombinase XerD